MVPDKKSTLEGGVRDEGEIVIAPMNSFSQVLGPWESTIDH